MKTKRWMGLLAAAVLAGAWPALGLAGAGDVTLVYTGNTLGKLDACAT
ncbi:hypothetical protein G3N55_12340 [Dissulfurirhabdus thermomarina]|uniref:Uncharacterized protein n=1 Tax=Dissulfurirhabdus thermomarina TaxID=1765737 RepID=A0A6N9TU56_DISTH|nr:hypothetical protein [Dissulfurirhabdus thermomarina]NDY43623.1 hypothetical protein [Dissulfurirhabdus thermomarina]